jgi:hypothetical protein
MLVVFPLTTPRLALKPTPPTRMMCGIARIKRNAVVIRFRAAVMGSTVSVTG